MSLFREFRTPINSSPLDDVGGRARSALANSGFGTVVCDSIVPSAAGLDPWRLVRHFRILRGPRSIGYASREVGSEPLNERSNGAWSFIHQLPRVAMSGESVGNSVDRAGFGINRVEFVPPERRRHLCSDAWSDTPGAEHVLVRGILVVIDEHPIAAFFLPPLVSDVIRLPFG